MLITIVTQADDVVTAEQHLLEHAKTRMERELFKNVSTCILTGILPIEHVMFQWIAVSCSRLLRRI